MRLSQCLLKGALYLAAFAGALSAQSIAVLTGSGGSSTLMPVFTVNPATNQLTLQVNASLGSSSSGAYQLYAKPGGGKYYVASSNPGLTLLDQNYGTPRQILGSTFNTSPRQAVFSPDGRRLFVIAGGQVYVLDTSTDQVLSTLPLTGTAIDVAFRDDSQWAFVLSTGSFTAYVTQVNMSSLTVTGAPLQFPMSSAAGIVTAPNGFVYVSGTDGLFEINPITFKLTPGPDTTKAATIPATGTYVTARVQFTSDSQTAVALDRNSGSAVVFNIPNKAVTVVSTANLNGASPDQLLLASDSRTFVHTTTNQLFELALGGGGFTPSPLIGQLPQGAAVQSMATSNEVQAKTLFVVASSGGSSSLYRFALSTNSLIDMPQPIQTGQSCALTLCSGTPPILVSTTPNPTSGAASVTIYNTAQTVNAGAYSLPLVARVLDANGAPVFGATVSYTVVNPGVTLSSATASTNFNGYAQVYATAGSNTATATVQVSTYGLPSTSLYTINVTGGSSGGGGCTGGNCTAGGLFIYGGNGQVIFEQQTAIDLLMVIVKDTNGNPISGQQVTFSITQGTGTTACTGIGDQFPVIPTGTCSPIQNPSTGLTTGDTVVTDSKGLAAVKFYATAIFNQSFSTTIINASSSSGNVNFYVTTIMAALPNGGGNAPLPAVSLNTPQPNTSGYRIIQGTTGQTIAGAIQVQVFAAAGNQAGQPMPNVALNVDMPGDPNSPNPKTQPSATCAGGTPLTDSTGTATCNLVLGPVVTASPYPLNVTVGSAVRPPGISIVVAQGGPSTLRVIQGNGQSGNAGAQVVLKGQVVDSSGSPVANVPVSWAVTQGSGTLSGLTTASDSSGYAQATITLGNTPGNVVVTMTATPSGAQPLTATFTLTVNASVGGITAASGGYQQTVAAGQPFGTLTVNVKDNSNPPKALSGVTVSFAVTSGSATLSAPTGTTDTNGNATVGVTAGTTPGPVVITASVGSQSVTFNLTVRAPGPSITATSFVNGASGAAGLTPCGIAIVSGAGLAPGVAGTVVAQSFGVGPLPFTLQGDSLTVNGVPAPIFWVSNTVTGGEAVAFQTPCEVTAGPATVVVTAGSGNTTVSNVPVAKYQPGFFTTMIGGKTYGVVQRVADGSFVTPDNPAHRGDTLKVFVTGLGTGVPSVGTNKAGLGGQASDAMITTGVNNGGVRTVGSEYLPGAIGIYTITFDVPADTATGPYQPLGLFLTDPADTTNTPIFALGTYIPIS